MSLESKKILFFGTPEFAVPTLNALVASTVFAPSLIITQPDKPSGRGQKLTPPPIKVRGEELHIPVFQPRSLKGLTLQEGRLSSVNPEHAQMIEAIASIGIFDAAIVIAYGKIIPRALLELPIHGCINIHGSILPRWRGAAPIHRALMAGDQETGISLMLLEEGLDTGPVFTEDHVAISSEATTGSLHDTLAQRGAQLLVRHLPAILSGELKPVAQPSVGVTYAEKWTKEDCRIQWSDSSEVTWRRIRTCAPHPGAVASFEGELVKIFNASLGPAVPEQIVAGTILAESEEALHVACGEHQSLQVLELQFPGKKRLPVAEVLRGRSFGVGNRFE